MTRRASTRAVEHYEALEEADGQKHTENSLSRRDYAGEMLQCHFGQVAEGVAGDSETVTTRLRDATRAAFEHWVVQTVVIAVILVSTACVLLETVPEYSRRHMGWFELAEKYVTGFFTIELLARVFIAESPCNYCVQPGNLIDTLAVLPWYAEMFARKLAVHGARAALSEDLADSFQTIRLMRVVRLAKAARHSKVVAIVLQSIHGSREGLSALFAFQCMGTVFAATIVFFLECEEEDTAFVSIPAAAWWALATVTGVGYGDMVPQTLAGKIAGSVTMVGGVLITSCSVAITTHSFIDQFHKNMTRHKVTERLRHSMSQLPHKSTLRRQFNSAQDLAGLVYMGDPSRGTMKSRLPKIQKELHNMLEEVHAMLRDGGEACAPGSSYIPSPPDATRDALVSSLEMLQEQSKVWFKQVQRLTDDIVRLELTNEDRERLPSTPSPSVATAPVQQRRPSTTSPDGDVDGIPIRIRSFSDGDVQDMPSDAKARRTWANGHYSGYREAMLLEEPDC